MVNCGVLSVCVSVRLVCVAVIQSWYVADEYWQATEIAHTITYRYGYETWEWKEGIRSVLYPSILAAIFKLISLVGCDKPLLLIHVPRLLHALAYAVGDYHIWRLSKRLYGNASAWWTLLCLCTSWFLCYCAPRTLTSCGETVLLSVAFAHYPWRKERECHDAAYLWFVGLACAIRPTAAVPFLPLALQHICYSSRRLRLMLQYLAITTVVLMVTVGMDCWYYDQLVVVPWRFIKFNVLSGLSAHYGTLPWHWYITQGLPATLTVHLIPFVMALLSRPSRHKHLLPVILWSLFIFSCLGHKEFRFLLPVLPLCLCVAGDHIAFTLAAQTKRPDQHSLLRGRAIVLGLVVPNLIAVLYLGLVHQRGPLDTMQVLRSEIEVNPHANILFLMPCHSTPYYSHLHKNITMRFLTCEPNLKGHEDYLDEADLFETDPMTWLQQEYGRLGINAEERGSMKRLRKREKLVDRDIEELENMVDSLKEDRFESNVEERKEDAIHVDRNRGLENIESERNEDTRKLKINREEDDAVLNDDMIAERPEIEMERGKIKNQSIKGNSILEGHVKNALPSHIVMFNVLRDKVVEFLSAHRYHLCHHLFNSHMNDGRRSQYIHIYCRNTTLR